MIHSASQMKLLADASNKLTVRDIKLSEILKKIYKKAKKGKYSYIIYYVGYERGSTSKEIEVILKSLGYHLDKDEYGVKISWNS